MRKEQVLPILWALALAAPAVSVMGSRSWAEGFPTRLPTVTISDRAIGPDEPLPYGKLEQETAVPPPHSGEYLLEPSGPYSHGGYPVGAGPAPERPRNYCPLDHLRYFSYTVQRDWRRNNCWPQPFPPADRAAVREPFDAMVAKGRERQNTFGDYHFEEDGQRLSEAGEMKLRAIVRESSEPYRSVFIARADTAEVTAARMETIQRGLTALDPFGPLPHVFETHMTPPVSSSEHIEQTLRRYRSSVPDPRIPRHLGLEMAH